MTEWKDISSAPRDGTQFLALVHNGWYTLARADPHKLKEGWQYLWWITPDRQNYPIVETHPKDTDWESSHTLILTHWMPLPPAPEAS